jgi:hypothetical protein
MLPVDFLELGHERPRRLRKEAAAERLRPHPLVRVVLAAVLRRAADLLDRPAPAPRLV